LQYDNAVEKQYQNYLDGVEAAIKIQQQDILLTNFVCKRNAKFTQILITVQTTQFECDIQLVLKTSEGDEVSLCSLKDVKDGFDSSLIFENQKVNFAHVLNQRIPGFCLPSGQQLLLRVTGGILLTDNILLYVSES